jgi:predicted metal-dependent enzyme (double-stranded beta helix superfamily)
MAETAGSSGSDSNRPEATTAPAERMLGGIGTNVIFEDDRVRVWRLTLAPGEASAIHHHELDHLLIQIDGDRVAVDPESDTRGKNTEFFEASVVPGMVHYMRAGGIETARNTGDRTYLEVIVELKDPAGPE